MSFTFASDPYGTANTTTLLLIGPRYRVLCIMARCTRRDLVPVGTALQHVRSINSTRTMRNCGTYLTALMFVLCCCHILRISYRYGSTVRTICLTLPIVYTRYVVIILGQRSRHGHWCQAPNTVRAERCRRVLTAPKNCAQLQQRYK